MVEIDQRQLDADEFLLNTRQQLTTFVLAFLPLMSTLLRISLPSRPVDPSDEGMDIWQDALEPSSAATKSSSIMFRRSLVFPLSGRSVSRA